VTFLSAHARHGVIVGQLSLRTTRVTGGCLTAAHGTPNLRQARLGRILVARAEMGFVLWTVRVSKKAAPFGTGESGLGFPFAM
jgi:hypothetical protein